MVGNGAGAFETDPVKIAEIMASWLLDAKRSAFDAMAAAARALGRPEAVYDIVRDLAELAQHNPHAVGWSTEAAADAVVRHTRLRLGAGVGLQLEPLSATTAAT